MPFNINYSGSYSGAEVSAQEIGSDIMQYVLAKYELNNVPTYFTRKPKNNTLVAPDGTVSMDYHNDGLEIRITGNNEDLLGPDILKAFPLLKKTPG